MTQAKLQNLAGLTFLLGVGAQKTGTTWLSTYLGKHPQVALSPIKELHYFDQLYRPDLCGGWNNKFAFRMEQLAKAPGGPIEGRAEHAWPLIERLRMINDPGAYLDYFDRLASNGAEVVGEITPSYSLIPSAGYRNIHELISPHVGHIKVIFIMRDPVDRFWSQLGHDTRKGNINSAGEHFSTGLTQPHYLERTRYDITITNLEKVFPPESIKYLFFESLFCETTLREVCDFLGIDFFDPPPAFYQQRINRSASEPRSAEATFQIREAFRPVYDFIFRKFGDRVPPRWHDIYSLTA